MEFNRLVSLVLGFIVLILLFVWISNRFRANTRTTGIKTVTVTISPTVKATVTPTKGPSTGWNPFGFLAKKTPTPTKTVAKNSPTPIKIKVENGTAPQGQAGQTGQNNQPQQPQQQTEVIYKNYKTGKTIVVNEIPETGAPTILLSLALAGLTGGIYLKKRI